MSLLFDAASEQVSHGTGISLTDPFTIMAWLRPSAVTAAHRHLGGQDQSTGRIRLQTDISGVGGSPRLFVAGTTNFSADANSGALVVDTWQCIAFRLDSSDSQHCRIFVGGLDTALAEVGYSASVNGAGMNSTSGNPLIVGRDSNASFPFEGDIASIMVWPSTALTLDQMILHQWKFRPHAAGCELFTQYGYNGVGSQIDWSGSGNDGTVTGATLSDNPPLPPAFGINRAPVIVSVPSVQLQAAMSCAVTAGAVLTTGITVAASAACSALVTAALTTSIFLGSAVNASASAAASLTTEIRFDAAPASTVNATGALTTEASFDAAVTVSATQASSLTTQIEMDSAVTAQAAAAGELTVGLNLDAAVSANAAAAGDLATQIPLAASAAASVASTAQLTTGISLVANVNGEAGSTGELSTDITLSADAAATLSVSGILNAQKIFNVVQRSADFKGVAAKSALFTITRNNKILFTRNRMKEVWF